MRMESNKHINMVKYLINTLIIGIKHLIVYRLGYSLSIVYRSVQKCVKMLIGGK